MDETRLIIRRQWNDDRRAEIFFEKLSSPHWDTISGGVQARAPQPFIHGYIWPEDILEGHIAYSGRHRYNQIKVCVVKCDNDPKVFKKLVELVGPKPRTSRTQGQDRLI